MTDDVSIRQHPDPVPFDRFQFMQRLTRWADEIGPAFRSELQAQAPVGDPLNDTHAGRLRGSIRYKRTTTADGVKIEWTAHTPYTPFVIHGTHEHDITPVAALALHFHDREGAEVFSRGTHHPGARANDFPKRAYEVMGQRMRDGFKNAVEGR